MLRRGEKIVLTTNPSHPRRANRARVGLNCRRSARERGDAPTSCESIGLQSPAPAVQGALSSGTYSLRQRVYDKGGNLSCSVTSFFFAAPVKVENAQADLRLLSPNGDGVKDTTLVSYLLRDAATVSARVYAVVNGQRAVMPIRTLVLTTPQMAGVNSFVWDGRADGGAMPADGAYAVVEPDFPLRDFTVSLHWSKRFEAEAGNQWLRQVILGISYS